MEKEMVNIGIRVDKAIALTLEKEAKNQGYTLSGWTRKIVEKVIGYPESERVEMVMEHDRLLEVLRRLSVTIAAERKLCLTYDEMDNFKLLERVAKWKFEEPAPNGVWE